MTAAKRRSSSGASQLGDDPQHHHSTSQQYHTSAESRPASDPDEQQSPPPYSSASSSSHHLGNYSTHNHHAQHNYHGHHHHNQNHYSHHHHQYQQLPQHGHHSDDASDEHLQQQQHQHHLHHQHHHQQQPHNAAMRDCSVKLPLDILWLPKSAMKPAGPDSPHTDCILVVGVSRPKLAAVFLTVMLISLFLTFHVLYDSAVYNIQAAQAVSEQHRLALLSGNRLPDYVHKPAAESSNQISHPMVFPSNRVHFPKTSRRLPQALIIGIRKCGTRALLEMLYLHPRIQKAGGEVHFFDRDENYMKGLEWYRKKMPHSFRGQITIEKSPSYFVSPEVPERVRAMNASIKLLLIVREPVTRAISDYTQLRSHAATASSLPPISTDGGNMGAAPSPIGSGLGALYTQQQKSAHSLLYQKLHGAAGLQSLSSAQVYDNSIGGGVGGGVGDEHPPHHGPPGHAADGTTTPSAASAAAAAAAAQMAAKSFEELALFPNGTVNESYRPLTISMYHLHLHRWLEVFPREQLLVVNGDRLIDDPVSQLQRIENFLGIEHRVTSSHFYFNETKGFYCLRYDNGDRCLRETKGRKHPHVDPVVVSKLRKFFAEHNQRFYELVGEDLGWPEE